ncbi:unnamed protein product [Cyclocybe aegerita]|uniref:Uncharacterized protein n=1 Tax=Cyclocybe aegerita TaxID=1973307 RepID=A0A8S0W6E2_CYCAE|nr:unnamed protein product [Cyclocybe aegerita]
MSVSGPGPVNITLPVPVSTSIVDADYMPETVPEYIKNMVIDKGVLFVDVLNAGAKVDTGLEDEEATNRGLIKNHWMLRVYADFGQGGRKDIGQIKFGMDVDRAASVGSNEGQYARSNRSDPDAGSDVVYSPVSSSFGKPPAPSSDDGVPAALPLVPATGKGSHDSHYSQSPSPVVSDVESVGKPPDIASSDGFRFQQPTEGAPHPGVFNIKVRGRTEPSRAIVVVFKLALIPDITFGQLLEALLHRNMLPFFFRKIGHPSSDFLLRRFSSSQAIVAWFHDAFLASREVDMILSDPEAAGDIVLDDKDIFAMLVYRWTNPRVPISDPSIPGPVVLARRSAARSLNLIDRAVWPANFVHVEHEKLRYNQVITTSAA